MYIFTGKKPLSLSGFPIEKNHGVAPLNWSPTRVTGVHRTRLRNGSRGPWKQYERVMCCWLLAADVSQLTMRLCMFIQLGCLWIINEWLSIFHACPSMQCLEDVHSDMVTWFTRHGCPTWVNKSEYAWLCVTSVQIRPTQVDHRWLPYLVAG